MKVVDNFNIRGRGWVATVEDAPPTTRGSGVLPGVLVHQDDFAWLVTGVEMFAVARSQSSIGLLLRPLVDAPPHPESGRELYL